MHLSPQEKDKLLIFSAALLAERRLSRGIKLNYPETIAFLSFQVLEGARDGTTSRGLGDVYKRQESLRMEFLYDS